MGTYRQPSQIIDKSLSVSNQGIQNIAVQMERGLARRRQQQLLDAREAKRKNEIRNKELKVFNEKKNAAIDGYREKMASWEHINQGADGQETQGVTIENQLRDNAKYYLDIMSGSVEGDERYRNAELAIRNMIAEYPLLADMLNKEAEQASNAYLINSNTPRNSNEPDAFLESNDPLDETKKSMLRNIKAGTNVERYNIQTGPNGVNLIYTDSDGKEVTINAKRYKTEKENGYNLVETTDAKAQKVFMDGVWSVVGKGYEGEGELKTTYTEFKEKGESLTETDKILHFTKANEKVEQQVSRWVEDNQGEVTQSQWQLLGGKGIFNREEDKEELVQLLTKAQIDNNGIPGSKLVSSSSVEKRLPGTSGKGTTPYTKETTSQLAGLGGVFNEVNTSVNKAFEMPQGDRVKTIKESINKNLPESANYAYLDFTQVKTQIEKERKKAVAAGNEEEVARLDELKKQYKLDQAPNKDLLYKKTFTKGKIQLDKPFDASDKDKVLRTIARERGITSEEAFEVFKSQMTNVQGQTFNPQNFKKQQPPVNNAQAPVNNAQVQQPSSTSNTGTAGLSTSQGGGSVTNVQPAVSNTPTPAPSANNNVYSANVTVDPQTNAVTFDFNGKAVDASKAASGHPVMKMKNDGSDYIREVGNFETLAGSGSGTSVTGYGFSGANGKLASKYKNAKGKTNEEKFINTVDSYIIGDNTPGKDVYGNDLSKLPKGEKPDTSILTDLNIDRATFDALPDDVKKEIVDWKMNSGRNVADIVVIASGGNWDGDKGARKNLPGNALDNVDYKNIDSKKLIQARRAMYKGTLDLIKEKYGEDSDKYKRAKAQYENSQQYR